MSSNDIMGVLLKNPEEDVHFIYGSKYRGTWTALGMEGIGKYVLSSNASFEGEVRDGTFHGHGSFIWPRDQRIDGIWSHGKCNQKRYIFNDGLVFHRDDWKYCTFPDRRYYTCLKYGLRAAGATLRTNNPTKFLIPFGCYNAGIGIFNPHIYCIASYQHPNKIIEIPSIGLIRWIKSNCQKASSEPTGYRKDLYENWYFETFDTTILPKTLAFSNNSSDCWWKRLTTFQRNFTRSGGEVKSNCSCMKINESSIFGKLKHHWRRLE